MFGSVLYAQECPQLPARPLLSEADILFKKNWTTVAEPSSVRFTVNDDESASHGIGYLKVVSANQFNDQFYYDWPRHIVIPLWTSQDRDTFYGWTHSGKVYTDEDNSESPLSGAGMVETDYEQISFIVHRKTDSGWLQLRVSEETPDLWTHECHLQLGDAKLTFESWEKFLEFHGDWLHFRDGVSHRLRSGPEINSPHVTMIGLDHKLTLHEIRGDWMNVTVEQPDMTCSSSDQEFDVIMHNGWVKWRDDTIGTWVWVYSRGC
jgi:hypothetical protein